MDLANPISRCLFGILAATLPHTHVVHDLLRPGSWDGKQLRLAIPGSVGAPRTAVLVQAPSGGPSSRR